MQTPTDGVPKCGGATCRCATLQLLQVVRILGFPLSCLLYSSQKFGLQRMVWQILRLRSLSPITTVVPQMLGAPCPPRIEASELGVVSFWVAAAQNTRQDYIEYKLC